MFMTARSPDIAENTRPPQGPAAGLPCQQQYGPYRAVSGSPASGRFKPAMARLSWRAPALAPIMGDRSHWRPILSSCWPPSAPCCAARAPEGRAQICCVHSAFSPS